jgi:hypothetical protein
MMTLAIVGLLIGLGSGPARAGADLGQFCVTLAPLVDTVRLSLTETAGPATMITASFRWRFGTSSQVGGTGTITESLLSPGSFDLALTGTHNTTLFGGNKLCSLFAVLTPPTFDGPWQYTCTGAGGAPFTGSGTLSFVPCTAAM